MSLVRLGLFTKNIFILSWLESKSQKSAASNEGRANHQQTQANFRLTNALLRSSAAQSCSHGSGAASVRPQLLRM